MTITRYDPAMASELASAYNRLIRPVPHCYPIGPADFAAAVAGAKTEKNDDKPLHSQAAYVATEGGAMLGFVDVGVRPGGEPGEQSQGMVRFLWYERGQRATGQALLEAAETHLRHCGVKQVTAFHAHYSYDFYHVQSAYLSDRLDHVEALLGVNGYKRVAGEVFLDWPDFEPTEPDPTDVEADISSHWREREGRRPAVILSAHHDGRQIGECRCGRIGDYSDDEAARDWFIVHWLWTAKEVRRRGLAKHLLQRALVEMHGAGYRHSTISTAWDNHRASLFYGNVGYHVVDWTYALGR